MRTYNHLEEYIKKLLHRLHIYHPHQLNIESVSARLGLPVQYIPQSAMFVFGNIFLDSRQSDAEQWQDFGHELCHALLHAGSQAVVPLSMREYQEWKANNFAQHLCIPTFMLEKMKFTEYDRDHIWRIEETFMVEKKFAEKRWNQHVMNLIYS